MNLTTTQPRALSRAARPRPRSWRRYQFVAGYLFVLPWIVGFIAFKLVPIVASFVFSFTDFYMLEPDETQFIGLANYARVAGDVRAAFSLFATLGYALVSVPVQVTGAIALAALFTSRRLRGKPVLRALFFMPAIVPTTAILFLWFGILDPSNGWLNTLILRPLGLPTFESPFTEGGFNVLQSLLALWGIGPGFLIMLGAMQGVPGELHAAAKVDGAGPILRLFNVTLPIISPAIFFSLIINLVTTFGGAALLDRSTAFNSSLSAYDAYITDRMFTDLQLGYAATLAWVYFVFTFLITALLFWSSQRWVYYPDEH